MHHTLLHGSAFVLDQTDSAIISAMRTEAEAMRILKSGVREPVAVYLRAVSGGANTLRVSIRQRTFGEARAAIAALFGGIMRLKHVYVFDEDIDIHDDRQVDWALGTRFQADQDLVVLQGMMGMTMDPSLNGRRTGAKSGFDCTKPFGRDGQIPLTALRRQDVQRPGALPDRRAGARRGADVLCRHRRRARQPRTAAKSPARSTSCARAARFGRDRDGRYHLRDAKPGITGIVGELYHDPNAGT